MPLVNCKKFSFLFFMFITAFISKAQDGTATIELDRHDKIQDALFSKDNGLWVITQSHWGILSSGDNGKIYKYSAGSFKKEWETSFYGLNNEMIYHDGQPNYIYFFPSPPPTNDPKFLSSVRKNSIYQLSPSGKLTERNFEKDEAAGYAIVSFCTGRAFCQVFTKKKSEDLLLFKHDHPTFKKKSLIIKTSRLQDGEQFGEWLYSGYKDSLIVLTRHSLKNRKDIEVIEVAAATGGILQNFIFQPDYPNIANILPGLNLRDDEGVHTSNLEDARLAIQASRASDYGDIHLSPDGTSLIYYALISTEGKRAGLAVKYPDGYVVSKLDLSGKKEWDKVEVIENEVLALKMKKASLPYLPGIGIKSANGGKAFSVEVNYWTIGQKNGKGSFLYNDAGERMDTCYKTDIVKGEVLKQSKKQAGSISELIPCFIKNRDKISKYIEAVQFDATYFIFNNQGVDLLMAQQEKGKPVELLYFN